MKLRTHDLTLDLGVLGEHTATIKYNYYPEWGGSRDEPPEPAEFELYLIRIGGVEVGQILSEEQFKDVEKHILEQLEEIWKQERRFGQEP